MKKNKKSDLSEYKFWDKKIENTNQAEKIVKDTAWMFIVVGIIMEIIFFFIFSAIIFDGIIYVILGLLFMKFRNKIMAGILIVAAISSAVVTILNQIGVLDSGGTNVFLALIVAGSTIRSWQAVGFLQKHNRDKFKNQ